MPDLKKLISSMSLEEKAGQVSIPMFQSSDITSDIEDAIVSKHAGFIRYSPNANYDNLSEPIGEPNRILTPAQTAELTNKLQSLALKSGAKIPLSINTDQEGGIETDINRSGVTIFTSQMGLSATRDPKCAFNAGYVLGSEMRAMGVTLNQTPALDVIKEQGYKAVKTLTFGDNTNDIIKYATAFVKGLKAGGAAVMLKHFPSYGSSSKDAHEGLPEIEKTKEQLWKEDMIIYKKCIEAGADAIMVGHVVTKCIDDSDTPASLSAKTISGFMRKELGFKGVVQTDAMRMRAILDKYGLAKASVMAVQAGNDAVLLRGDKAFFEEGYYAILDACKKGHITRDRIDDAVFHILDMKAKLGLFKNAYADPKKAAKTVGCEKHRKISMQVAGKSVTLFKNKKKTIPLKLNYTQRVLVITTLAKKLVPTTDPIQCPEMLLNAIKKNHPNAQGHFTTMSPTAQDISKCVELAKNADVVIMATANAILRSQQAALIKALVKELNSLKKPLVVVAMQSPHDIVEFPGIDTYLCTYELANDCMLAASDIIFGLCKPSGKLPVKIK